MREPRTFATWREPIAGDPIAFAERVVQELEAVSKTLDDLGSVELWAARVWGDDSRTWYMDHRERE